MAEDVKGGAPSTPTHDELNAASDAALAKGDIAEYTRLENARELSQHTGAALPEIPPVSPTPSEKAASEPAPATEIQDKKPKNGEDRKVELAAEIQELLNKKKLLKAELDGNAYTDKPTEKPGEKVAAPPPAPVKAPAPADATGKLVRPVKPQLTDFPDFPAYDEANDEYIADLATFKAATKVETQRAEAAQAAAAKRDTDERAAWGKQIEAARATDAEFDAIALNPTLPISGPMFEAIRESENGAKLLLHLGRNVDLSTTIATLPTATAQALAIVRLEAKLYPETAEKVTTPVKKHTAAPPPATDLSSKNTESADPELAALQRGDTETYMRLANAREVKAARGR